ncbi:hypothetical protein P7D52_13575 [Enterococcus dongliensis]|uniref:Uncharacterized protein n=1 Tax=Enterococcus dongliensis TaxID=2559925 RepID=A0AAW8TKG4_9ENTE|nr:hypothetical protein [Enterococcus dongliensis]MDT2635092.1 hypothetical protein [Enterococcus dongliensis]MDT2636226.1 hypothetical protein [Enterococcus dongliensis]MDT2639530.1 hypothetical protein [Enterococcus dongliensis]MDT2643798.1 hypothetical protein [Enterococcus dongliensis]
MIYDDNFYTGLLADLSNVATEASKSNQQVGFLVGPNLIFGDVIDDEDERLTNTDAVAGSSIILLAAANVIGSRRKMIEKKFNKEQKQELEPVYTYLNNVTIHSTSNNKSIHLDDFALRISSIDGMFVGSIDSLSER